MMRIEMQLLRCPRIDEEKFIFYTQKSQKNQTYSNFGPCEMLLRNRLANILGVDPQFCMLGSSATSLLQIACELSCTNGETCRFSKTGYFPNFSFFSTFSVAYLSGVKIKWYDLNPKTYMPALPNLTPSRSFVYLTVPFGTDNLLEYFKFARSLETIVVIDAAACLPTIIHKAIKLTELPENVIIVFSLHATKLISSGEGGVMVFGRGVPQHAKTLTNFGLDERRIQSWPRAFNAKMSEFNAAAGLASLDCAKSNISKIINAKKKAEKIGGNYGLKFFADIKSPTLTLNILVEDAEKIIKNNNSEFPLRQWWGLNRKDVEQFPVSQMLYGSLLGVPFDWECLDDYFPDFCKFISDQ